MAKMFAIARCADVPQDVRMYDDAGQRLYSGHVLCGRIGPWAGYIFSGTAAELANNVNAKPNVYGICAVTESGDVKWAELDGVIAAGVREKLNTWLTARGYPTIPATWTYRRVVLAIFQRLNDRFDLAAFDVMEA